MHRKTEEKQAVVNVHAAKTQFSKLLARVEKGEEIVIARGGKPVAKLSPAKPPAKYQRPKFGFMKGTIKINGEIDDPMPDEWLDLFYNGPISSAEADDERGEAKT